MELENKNHRVTADSLPMLLTKKMIEMKIQGNVKTSRGGKQRKEQQQPNNDFSESLSPSPSVMSLHLLYLLSASSSLVIPFS